jgi:hypothetical protein
MTAVEYKHFKERVEAALYSKGKRAGLRNLESDDVHLLYSLRPAEPHEDFDGVLDLVNNAQCYLRVLFKLYCLEGASANKGVEGMGKNQWSNFCIENRFDTFTNPVLGGTAINLATCDRIFIR